MENNNQTNQEKKGFFKDKKNIAIVILSLIVCGFVFGSDTTSTNTIETSSNNMQIANLNTELENLNGQLENLKAELNEANAKITELETSIQTLTGEKEQLITQLNEKSGYILNLEAQVGGLTAEKSHLEAQKGILEQQLEEKTTKQSPTKSTSSQNTSYTVYVTNTGDKYHKGSCSYLRSSKNAISKDAAVSQGYTACSRCNP